MHEVKGNAGAWVPDSGCLHGSCPATGVQNSVQACAVIMRHEQRCQGSTSTRSSGCTKSSCSQQPCLLDAAPLGLHGHLNLEVPVPPGLHITIKIRQTVGGQAGGGQAGGSPLSCPSINGTVRSQSCQARYGRRQCLAGRCLGEAWAQAAQLACADSCIATQLSSNATHHRHKGAALGGRQGGRRGLISCYIGIRH